MPLTEAEARRNLQSLVAQCNNVAIDERRGMSEASAGRKCIDRLLEEVLGLPIKDPQRQKHELHTQSDRTNVMLIPKPAAALDLSWTRIHQILQGRSR